MWETMKEIVRHRITKSVVMQCRVCTEAAMSSLAIKIWFNFVARSLLHSASGYQRLPSESVDKFIAEISEQSQVSKLHRRQGNRKQALLEHQVPRL